jgi:hypothetical protein
MYGKWFTTESGQTWNYECAKRDGRKVVRPAERKEMSRSHVYIVGAGFSRYAGLPLQAGFTEALLEPRADEEYPMLPLIGHLGEFVHGAFDHNVSAKAQFWPNLEDVFTNIDMAANTGHHLGSRHPPSMLRTTRRVLLARMMCMLHERFTKAAEIKDNDWLRLNKFFNGLDIQQSAFISINWDTVIERRLSELKNIAGFDYGCGAIAADLKGNGTVVSKRKLPDNSQTLPVVKIHGSVNWLYCDNCRRLYWFPAEEAIEVALQLIRRQEGKELKLTRLNDCERWNCSVCTEVPLTTRIATFSFLKALDFPMFETSWLSAEKLLRKAKKWIFVGYSLPAADYQFKHLLKRVQLSRAQPPEFVVITGGSREDTEYTYANYQRFFGRGIRKDENVFRDGLSNEAIEAANS